MHPCWQSQSAIVEQLAADYDLHPLSLDSTSLLILTMFYQSFH